MKLPSLLEVGVINPLSREAGLQLIELFLVLVSSLDQYEMILTGSLGRTVQN